MTTSKQEYAAMSKRALPKSKTLKNTLSAFLSGGIICVLGQIMVDIYTMAGITAENAKTVSTLTLVFLAALLTGIGVYDKIAKFAGAGTLVPITGFANSMVSPAIEFKKEGYVLGMGAKMFSIAGPVLVFGISASVIYGVILFLIGLI